MDQRSTSHWRLHLLLLAATAVCYVQVVGYGFVAHDDPPLVLNNPNIQGGWSWAAVRWALGVHTPVGWNPLAWFSHILDWQLFGSHAGGHHLTNLIVHMANVSLLFALVRRMTGAVWRSAAVAGLLAIHPQHVESVAWIAERRDVLCMFGVLLTLHAYVSYSRRRTAVRYGLVLVCFALALMSKPMAATLPCAMLLLDAWPLRRFNGAGVWSLAVEKAPLLAMSAVASCLTVLNHHELGAFAQVEHFGPLLRVQIALVGYSRYLLHMFLPIGLVAMYPLPPSYPWWQVCAAGGVFVAVTTASIWQRRRAPYLLVGWLWFLGTMVPVTGLFQVGVQAMADRFAYIPMIGVYVAVVWLIGDAVVWQWIRQRLVTVIASMVFVVLWVLCFVQVGYWSNSITLYDHAVRTVPDNAWAMNNLGAMLVKRQADGDLHRAMGLFNGAVAVIPEFDDARMNLAKLLHRLGRTDDAAPHYVIRAGRFADEARQNRDARLRDASVKCYAWALQCRPNDVNARFEIARLLIEQGRVPDAVQQLQQVLVLQPEHARARELMQMLMTETRGQGSGVR